MNLKDSYDDYPHVATDASKLALKCRDKYGREEVQGGTEIGWTRANQLAKKEKYQKKQLTEWLRSIDIEKIQKYRKNLNKLLGKIGVISPF